MIEKLQEFVDSKQQRVFILNGRGGIGKTKLLHAFAQKFKNRYPNFVLRFLMEGAPITSESVDELPTEPCVVVVDDAHRREDLPVLFAVAQQRPQPLKLVLSSRPQGVDHLRSRLTQAGFDFREILTFEGLKELSRDEVKELARQALGSKYAYLADQLAAVTWDCPLVTLIGGRLLAEREVSPHLLERDAEFRDSVLTKFQDVLVGKLSDRIEPKHCESLLKLIATVAPFQPESDQFQQTAAEFLGIEKFTLGDDMNILEESGILLRRGYSLRITPDVLADHILHEACLTKPGRPTGYVQQVFEKFKSIFPTQVLRNLAELDWRILQADGEETDLLADIWQSIWEEFRQASNFDRCKLLDILKQVAPYQPGRSLELVEFAMRNPATTPEDESVFHIYSYTHNNVLGKLPELLQSISYTFKYFPHCCDLLWELRKRGIGILKEIASYDIYKPLEANQAVLEAVTRWLKSSDKYDDICSLLDILDPLLAKSSYSTDVESHQIIFSPFVVSIENTHPIREQALQLIVDCATSNQLEVVIRAVKSLENALRKPIGFFGQEIPIEEEEQWVPEQLRILKIVNGLVAQVINPMVHLNIIEVLRWHTRYSSSEEVKQKAKNIITSIPKSHELLLTGALKHSYNWDWLLEDGEDIGVDDKRRDQHADEICLAVAKEFLQRHPVATDGMQTLNESLQVVVDSGVSPYPCTFLGKLSELNPSYAAQICEALIEVPDSPLVPHVYSLLYGVRTTDAELAITIAKRAINTGNNTFCRALAGRYLDLELTKKLLCHNDFGVRKLAINALGALKNSEPQLAITVALTVDIGNSTELASELCQVFDAESDFQHNTLTDEELGTLLGKLEPITNINEEPISEFVAYASERVPRSVIQLLLKRIERDEEDHDGNYQPLPYHGFQHKLNGLTTSEEYEDILRDIREQALKRTHSWLPKLFKEASLGFNSTSLKVLDEWTNSGNAERIQAVSSLLHDAPRVFVFREVDFVTNLLEKAYALGDDCYKRVIRSLFNSATSGERSGTVGQPFPEDVALRDQSAAVTARFVVGSLSYRFYDSLAKHAEASIRNKKVRDEERLN